MKSPIPVPVVNLDKTVFSLKTCNDFEALMIILAVLFVPDKTIKELPKNSLHRNFVSYEKDEESLIIFYNPNQSGQPDARLSYKTSDTSVPPQIFSIINDFLINNTSGVDTALSKNNNCLSIWVSDKNCQPVDADVDVEGCNLRIRRLLDDTTRKTNELLILLDRELSKNSFSKKSDGLVSLPTNACGYRYYRTFFTPWFRINVRYNPFNPYLPPVSLQFDSFVKPTKNSYLGFLFLLLIFSWFGPVKPSYLELAFDFYNQDKDFLLELGSLVHVPRKKPLWSIKKGEPLRDYTQPAPEFSKASHYYGSRKCKTFYACLYNHNDFSRFEFRLTRSALRNLMVNSIYDLICKNWTVETLGKKKILFGGPTKKSFELVDEQFQFLTNINLSAFLSKIDKENRLNLTRELIYENLELRDIFESAALEFHNFFKQLYLTSGVVITDYGDSPITDLKTFFENLPQIPTCFITEGNNSITFSISANNKIHSTVQVGELAKNLIDEIGSRPGYAEKFIDGFNVQL